MQKPYLYAGKKMGSTVAAWKQGFRAELAAESGHTVNYCEALLDLVKAFDYVPHWVLIREGLALGYPLWLLRLSIATYKMSRVLRVRKVVSGLVWAFRGMTAGSGFATTEMRVVMINLVERALQAHPSVTPTIFVDDLAAESAGPDKWIKTELGGFIEIIVDGFKANRFELSGTKSLVTASTDGLGKMMVDLWQESGICIKYASKVKSLGVGLGAGVRETSTSLGTDSRA